MSSRPKRRRNDLEEEAMPVFDETRTTAEAAKQLEQLEKLSPEQVDQYESYRRSHFHADAIRQVESIQ
jgi:hypothetical protein